ncbi:hypothetical protein M9H77_09672 [Catharanthus roseus]|uniref:Uncharacterized protein n=1 Tax=Catharanthus roseus TaxID=4058 RepID=A0ACC0C1F5_CATRO|nr:hypothetical protein M9H77_09672 [Catharanthus roseus]
MNPLNKIETFEEESQLQHRRRSVNPQLGAWAHGSFKDAVRDNRASPIYTSEEDEEIDCEIFEVEEVLGHKHPWILWPPSDIYGCKDYIYKKLWAPWRKALIVKVLEDNYHTLEQGLQIVLGHYLTVARWRLNFKPSSDVISTTIVWVRFQEMPMELFDEEFLMSLGNKLGKPIRSGPKDIARFRREICEGLRTYQLEETIDFIQKHVRLSPKNPRSLQRYWQAVDRDWGSLGGKNLGNQEPIKKERDIWAIDDSTTVLKRKMDVWRLQMIWTRELPRGTKQTKDQQVKDKPPESNQEGRKDDTGSRNNICQTITKDAKKNQTKEYLRSHPYSKTDVMDTAY